MGGNYRNTVGRRLLLLAVLLFAIFPALFAQTPELINNKQFQPEAKAAVDSIYNFNFEGADERLSTWREQYPSHPLWTLMEGMKLWWKVLSDLESTSHDKRFINIMKKADYRAGKLLHDQPGHADGLIIRAISNGYLARHHANRGNWLTSINYGRKAMKAHQYLMERQPGFADLKLAEGLKLYYSAYLPEAYPIVTTVSWALPAGDKAKGLQLLREASNQAIFAAAEATYFLGNIYYNYEKKYKVAVQKFERLQSRYPRNNYYARVLVKSYFKNGQFDKALEYIDQTLERWKAEELPNLQVMQEELLTWKGRILEQRGQREKALKSYRSAFESSNSLPDKEERSYFVVSGYLAGKLLRDLQRPTEAKRYLAQVSKADTEPDYRKRARKLLSEIN